MSNAPWDDDRCIVCLRSVELTSEHVIPRVLGGKLTCSFLCRACNSGFGAKLDVQVKTDPAIKMAVQHLKPTISSIAKGYFEGQVFQVKGAGPDTQAVMKKGTLKTRAATLTDGSLMIHTSEGRKQLDGALNKAGATPDYIAHHLERFDLAPDNEVIDFIPGVPPMAKWTANHFEPDLSGTLVCPEFLLKIAYEYTALSAGATIFDEKFDALRQALKDNTSFNGFHLDQHFAAPYQACHGIAVTCRYPYTVQIMLFGKCRYKLTFPDVYFGGDCISYYHDLESNSEGCKQLELSDGPSLAD